MIRQSFGEPPAPSPKQFAERIKNIDSTLYTLVKTLLRGEKQGDVYKPWSKKDVKRHTDTILGTFQHKLMEYDDIGKAEETERALKKIEEAKRIFSILDNSEQIPEDFLEKVRELVENDVNLSEDLRRFLDKYIYL